MKLRIKTAFAAAGLFVLSLSVTLNAAAQSSLTLRPVGKPEFIFSSLQDPLLFSETAFEKNPAVLAKLKTGFLRTDLLASFSQEKSTDTRLDASIGSLAGTFDNLSRTFLPSLDITHLFPVGKKNPALFGYQLSGGMDYSLFREVFTDYNSFSEQMTVQQEDLPWEIKGGLFLSLKPKTPSFGFFAGYGLSYAPSLFRLITDESFIPSETYVQDEVRNADTWTHSAYARAGLLLPLSRTAEVSLSADYEGGFADASRIWYYFDTNGNGTNDGLMPYADYVFYTGAGGPAERALSYEAKDLTISTRVLLHPHLRVFLSDKLEMFISGTYHLFDFSDRQYYTHVALPSDLELDQSLDRETHNRSYTSFSAMPGVAIKAGASTLVKLGIGFSRLDDRFTLDGVQRQGLTKFNRLNTEKYPELSLGLEPVNNALIDNAVEPAQTLTQSIFLKSGLEYKPSSGLSLFAGLEASGSFITGIYRAYNLDTRSVWSETITSQGVMWNIMPAAGVAVKTGKNLTWVINLKGTGISGNFTVNGETAPFDDFGGRTTLNGARDLSAGEPFSFEVAMSFLFSR